MLERIAASPRLRPELFPRSVIRGCDDFKAIIPIVARVVDGQYDTIFSIFAQRKC